MIAMLERKQQLYRLIGLTAVAAAFGALLSIHLPGDVRINYAALYALVAVTMGTGVVLLLGHSWFAARPVLFWPIAGGLFPALEATSVYFTGGVRSPFFVLFYFSLFFIGMVGGHAAAILGSIFVGFLYVLVCVLHEGSIGLDSILRFTVTLGSFYGIAFFAALLGSIAWQAARDASRRAMRIAGLNAVHTNLGQTLDLDELLEKIPRELCDQLGFERALLFTPDDGLLRLRAGHAVDDPQRLQELMRYLTEHPSTIESRTVEAAAARSRRPVVISNPAHDPRVQPEVLRISGTHGLAAAPMLSNEKLMGVVVADYGRNQRSLAEEETTLLDTFARTAAFAISNAQLLIEAGRAEAFRQLDTLKTEFLSTVSHELRTPLTLVRTSTDLLKDDVSEGLNPTQRQLIATIGRNSDRLTAFVEEILEMAQLDEGRVQLNTELGDLRYLVDEVASTLQLMVGDRNQTLYLDLPDEPCMVEMDRHRIQQVVTNLITNACKYTPEGGKLWVRVLPGRDSVTVEVEDNGPGIPSEKLEHVFEKFYRLPGSGSRAKGSGLGLAITRSLVELHGGRIGVVSEPNKGARFWFSVPSAQYLEEVGAHQDVPAVGVAREVDNALARNG